MHSALLISELLRKIVDCLAQDIVGHHDQDSNRQALAVLARTCRAFSKPALDAIWREVHNLRPFILCLPAKASYASDDTLDEPLPPFDEEELNVVLRYAPRVHKVSLEHDDISMKILQSLCFCTTLPFPNLRKLHWVHGDHSTFALIHLLLTPSLVHLHVWLDDGHTSILAFLQWYHTLCPNLESLHFGYKGRSLHLTAAVSRAIARSPNVKTLSCDRINEEGLIYVVQSRCIGKLKCNLVNHEPRTLRRVASYGTPDHPPFKNIRILELDVGDFSSIIPYFKHQNQPFEEVTIGIHTVSAPEDFHEFFTALCSATRRRTLRRLRISTSLQTGFDIPSYAVNSVGFQVLSPLLTLNLHEFYINIRNPISLNDGEFVQLAQGWPELETLAFNGMSRWDYSPTTQLPTLRGLLLLLARCPKLRNLGLCVDASNVPVLLSEEELIRNTAITTLSVSNSPIQEPVTNVVHFLHKHLPSLVAVPACVAPTGQMSYHWAWRRVDRELRHIVGRRSPEWDDAMDL